MNPSANTHNIPKAWPIWLVGLAIFSLLPGLAWSQNTWTDGGGDDAWGTAANWSGGVPAATDQLILGDDPADAAQIINLGVDRTVENEFLIESTGSRDYTLSGATLNIVNTTASDVGFESGAGTTDLTVNSDISFSNILASGISYLQITGSGTRSIHLNGNISDGGGPRSNRLRMNAANTQLHLSGSNSLSTILFSAGEVVAHSVEALGDMQIQGGNSTLSVSSDVNIGSSGGSATFLSSNLDVRIREESASAADRILTFEGRITSTSAGAGAISIVPNINSTGRVILQAISGHPSPTVVNDAAIDLGTNGIYRISITSTGYFGPNNGTGIISGQGDVEVDGGGDIYFTAVNTYSGSTTLSNASTLLLSGNGSIAETSRLEIGAGSTLDISGITASGYTFESDQTVAGTGLISTGDKDLTLNGTLAPGSSPGTLSVDLGTGTFSLGSNTDLQFELGTASDLVNLISGTLDIGTGTLGFDDFSFTDGAGFGVGQYTLFQTTESILGSFAGNTTGTVGGFNGELQFSGNDLILDVSVVPEPGTASLLLIGGLSLALLRRKPQNG